MDRDATPAPGGGRPIRRGELYWVEPDESRGAIPALAHPHVVIQDDLFNASRISTVIVCALTTRLGLAKEPGNVLLDAGEGGLEKQSVVVVSQISSLYRTRLRAFIGTLSPERVEEILAGLRAQQRLYRER